MHPCQIVVENLYFGRIERRELDSAESGLDMRLHAAFVGGKRQRLGGGLDVLLQPQIEPCGHRDPRRLKIHAIIRRLLRRPHGLEHVALPLAVEAPPLAVDDAPRLPCAVLALAHRAVAFGVTGFHLDPPLLRQTQTLLGFFEHIPKSKLRVGLYYVMFYLWQK